MADQTFEITKQLGIIKEKKGGWIKELNIVSWYEGSPKYDIRDWSKDHQKMSKGVTLTEEELINLYYLIGELFFDKPRGLVNKSDENGADAGNDADAISAIEEIIDIKEERHTSNLSEEDDFLAELAKMEETMNGKD